MTATNQRLHATVNIGGALSKSFRGAISGSRKQIASVGDAINQLKKREQRLARVGDHWEKQGRDARAYREELERVRGQLGKIRRANERVGQLRAAKSANLRERDHLQGQMLGAVAIGGAVGFPIAKAVQFESTMADLNKVADLTPKRLGAVRKEILGMSRKMPMAADQIGAIMTAAAQAGIAKDEMTEFTRSAIKMGTAFDVAGGEAGTIMSKWRSGLNLTQPEVEDLADATNYLSNNLDATGPQIADVVRRVGPLAKVAGLAGKQTAALAGALIDAGGQPERVATGIRKLSTVLNSGASATKDQKAAMQSLGMTVEGTAKSMQKDADGTILKIFERLKKVAPDQRVSVVQQLFGTESLDTITPLLTNIDKLRDSMDSVSDRSKYAGSIQKEYEQRAKTTANQLQLLQNKVTAVGVTLGTVMLPPLKTVADGLGTAVDKAADLADEFPVATKAIVGAAVGLAGLKIGTLGLRLGFNFLKGGVMDVVSAFHKTKAAAMATSATTLEAKTGPTALGKTFKGLGGTLKGFVRMVGGLRLASLFNPVGLAVTGIAVAGTLIVKYWKPIKAFFKGVGEGIKGAIQPVVKGFSTLLDNLGPVGDGLRAIGKGVGTVIDWIGKLFEPVNSSKKDLKGFEKAGRKVGTVLTAVVVPAIGAVTGALLANPIGLAVTVIAGGALLIYKNWDGISAFFQRKWQHVKKTFHGSVGDITKLLLNWNPIGGVYRLITKGLEKLGVDVPDKFKTLGGLVVDGIGGALKSGLKFLVTDLPEKFLHLGTAIIGGVIKGIKSKAKELKDSVLSVGSSVSGWFKDKLGIHSPSRVFAAHGRDTLEGYRLGLTRQEPKVVGEIGKVARRVAQAGAGIGLGAAAMTAAAADMPNPSAVSPAGAQGGTQVTQDNRVYVTAVQNEGEDAEAFAQRVAEIIEEKQRRRERAALYDIGTSY